MQAQYYRDPDQLAAYLAANHFLTSINNEIPVSRNATYARNFAALDALVLVLAPTHVSRIRGAKKGKVYKQRVVDVVRAIAIFDTEETERKERKGKESKKEMKKTKMKPKRGRGGWKSKRRGERPCKRDVR